MSQFSKENLPAIREIPALSNYGPGDVLVLFGELFSRGYANGLVEEAEAQGMTIVRATVGRREKDNSLRALSAEEIQSIPKPFINIPLEAGFDMEPDNEGMSPCDRMKDCKLNDWESLSFSNESIESSRQKGRSRFTKNTQAFLQELTPLIPAGKKVLFAHLMAGGVPRTKIIMPLMNKAFKGQGDRHLPSEKLFASGIGQFCLQNFLEVTAETFKILVEESSSLRDKISSQGGKVSYLAYGYHGTEVLESGRYRWQTYTPYFQGWAKMQLEDYAQNFFKKGISCCVYNCPEILTNSSSVFQGVELSLYNLIPSLLKEGIENPRVTSIVSECKSKLKPEVTFTEIQKYIEAYLNDPLTLSHADFQAWPQNSSLLQMEKMLQASDHLIGLHLSDKDLITSNLSEVVFKSCGFVMLHESLQPKNPVQWINHDIVSKVYLNA